MCNFFSFCSNGNSKWYYFDWVARQKVLSGELRFKPDSHASIAEYFELNEDKLNKYEFNPLTGKFVIDQINTTCDVQSAEAWVRGLDFKTIVPALIIKPIVNPSDIENALEQCDIDNLKKWASVGDSVGASARASVGASVWASVGDSVGASVWASVKDSVWVSVRAPVWAPVWAYISSFFNIQYEHDFTPCIELWERGFVPSFDGETWRLHGKAGIVYEHHD